MKSSIADLRALLAESCCAGEWRFNEATQTVVSVQSHPLAQIAAPAHRLTFAGKTGREGELIAAAVNALPELLAIAEAVEAAQVGKVDIACASDAVVVDGLDNPQSLVKQRVKLVPLPDREG